MTDQLDNITVPLRQTRKGIKANCPGNRLWLGLAKGAYPHKM